MVSVFLVRTISLYQPKFEFLAVWSSSTMAAAIHTDRRLATQVFTQANSLLLLDHVYDMAYCWSS